MWFRRRSLQQSLSALYKLSFLLFSSFLRFHWQAKRIPARLLWQKCNLRILAFGSGVECVHFLELEMFKLDFSPLKYANVVRTSTMKVPLSFLHKWKLVGPSTRWGSRRTSEISQGSSSSSANCDVTRGWFPQAWVLAESVQKKLRTGFHCGVQFRLEMNIITIKNSLVAPPPPCWLL